MIGFHLGKSDDVISMWNNFKKHGIKLNAVQIFLFGPQNTKKVSWSHDHDPTLSWLKKRGITIFVHGAYVSNPWSGNQKLIGLVKREQKLCNRLNLRGPVIHLPKIIDKQFYTTLKKLANRKLILEINATCFLKKEREIYEETGEYSTLLEIDKWITRHRVPVGICVDTAHLWSKGYDVRDWKKLRKMLNALDNLELIHLNDSQRELGSCVDKHGTIGKDRIWSKDLSSVKKLYKWCNKHKVVMMIERAKTPDASNIISEIQKIK